jgi:hypothetical protein
MHVKSKVRYDTGGKSFKGPKEKANRTELAYFAVRAIEQTVLDDQSFTTIRLPVFPGRSWATAITRQAAA